MASISKDVRITISLATDTQKALHYNAYMSEKAIKEKVASLKAQGLAFKIVNVYTNEVIVQG